MRCTRIIMIVHISKYSCKFVKGITIVMKRGDMNAKIIDSYFGLLKNLSSDAKLELIARLSNSMKSSKKRKDNSLQSLYGTFISEKSAEELIDEIRQARTFNRKRAAL